MIAQRGEKDATTLLISKNPAEMAASNVALQPGDTVVVQKAGIVYVCRRGNSDGWISAKFHGRNHGLASRSCRRRADSRRLCRKDETASSY